MITFRIPKDKNLCDRKVGLKFRNKIIANWNKYPISIDFDKKVVATTAFLDEAIAKLFLTYSADDIKKHIYIKNIHPMDRDILRSLITDRRGKLK